MRALALMLIPALLSGAAKLPSTFKKCNIKQSDFDNCLSVAIKDAVQQLTKPFPEVGLISLDPLEIPSMSIGAGSGPVQLTQNLKNVKAVGISSLTSLKVHVDKKTKVVTADVDIPKITLNVDYDIDGKVLVMPVKGNGPGVITLEKPKFLITFHLDETQKKGTKYYLVKKSELTIDTQRMGVQLDNLFDGNKALGDNINKMLNENWKIIFAELKPLYESAFEQIMTSAFNSLLSKVPAAEVFGEE